MNATTSTQFISLYGAQTPAASMQAYISWVQTVPMLTAEEEESLARRMHEQHDLDAARQLVMAHLRFVVRIARGYGGYGLSQADLIQEGNIGLMKAVKRFDPNVGVRLAAFAVHWIKAEMHEFIIRNWRIVKIATTKAQRKLFFKMRSLGNRLGWNTPEDVRYVAETLSVSEDEVRHMEKRMSAPDTAFEAPVGSEFDDGTAMAPSPSDYLSSGTQDNPAFLLESESTQSWELSQLHAAMASLDDRSADIIRQRWLEEKKVTLQELSNQYGISIERVRQIEAAAIKNMQSALGEN